MSDPITAHVMGEHLNPPQSQGPDSRPRLSSWQLCPELPRPSELMAKEPPPLPDLGDDVPTKDAYLETQYRLQRYEGTELLRQAINNYRKVPGEADGTSSYIYTQVRVKGYVFARQGAACRISFSTERSPTKVYWNQTKRLTAGTLVALSPRSDNFKTKCFVAIVAARYLVGGLEPDPRAGEDENTPPRIEIFWADSQHAIIDPTMELVMLEAKGGYFETVRYAMVGLQHAALFDSKFDKYIVEGHRENPSAEYIQQGQGVIVPKTASTFDHSQMEAFRRMTSRELAIVQGPPGTGKTFTSVVAIESYVQTLQANRGKDEPPVPVIVAAQTNHALDQLLERCLSYANIARLGGRSTVDSINERSIFNIRRNSKAARADVKGEISRKNILQKVKVSLSTCFPGGIISAEHFHRQGLLTQDQFTSLEEDEWESIDTADVEAGSDDCFSGSMAKWLDGCIEQDRTYVYRPPRNQAEHPAPEESDCYREDCTPDDDERERLQGDFLCTEFYWTGTVPGHLHDDAVWCFQAQRLLSKFSDLYQIKPPQRGMVYRYLRKALVDKASGEFPGLLIEHQRICDTLKISRWQNNIKVLQHDGVQVLGCTTTGLTKYRGMIAALKPRILMIEEAAETRESNITSALYPSLDQVVLVGDHQQLVPHVDVHILGHPPYNLQVSLFERLVRMQLPYSMLCVQRRMIPTLREVVHAFYPKLEDHGVVKNPQERPPVPGMGGRNLWWFQHQWGEQHDANTFAYSNVNEANMIVGFVRYLVQNGMRPSQITILTYYKGQVNLVLETLKKNPVLSNLNPTKQWDVRTVDGFQGEENEIILLSLVRSRQNPYDAARVGFVDNENRAVVATSRARCGMYVFGNSNHLLDTPKSKETWQKVYNVFVKNNSTGYKLPVVCKSHGRVTNVKKSEDWDNISWGGCAQPCDEKCPNGHPCDLTCHPHDQSQVKCRHPCEKILPCGHDCKSFCGHTCECPRGCNKPALRSAEPQRPRLPTNAPSQPKATHQAQDTSQVALPAPGSLQVPQFLQEYQPQPSHAPLADRGGRSSKGRGNQRGKKTKGRGNGQNALPTRTKSAAQKSQVIQMPAPVKPPALQPQVHDRREMTSEDMMRDGYHTYLTKQEEAVHVRGGRSTNLIGTSRTVATLIDTTLDLERTSSEEDSVSDKWSTQNFRTNEKALERSLIAESLQAKPVSSIKVQETFRQITTDVNGARALNRVIRAEYTLPADGEPISQPILDLISGDLLKPSRKQQVLDAAANYIEMELNVPSLQPEGEPAGSVADEPTSEEEVVAAEMNMDLITF